MWYVNRLRKHLTYQFSVIHLSFPFQNLRRPYLLNDLKMQRVLMDRRRVYDLLEEAGIDVPRHVFVSRDGYVSTGELSSFFTIFDHLQIMQHPLP